MKRHPWIQTYSGVKFDLVNPTPDMVLLEDIAHAISRLNRFTGHIHRYNDGQDYTVAEHCVLGSRTLNSPEQRDLAFQFLMHDAHEAYTGDIAAPIKWVVGDAWHEFESRIASVVRAKFGLPDELDPLIREIDVRMLETERKYLLGPSPDKWATAGYEPYTLVRPRCWTPTAAKIYFLSRFKDLSL